MKSLLSAQILLGGGIFLLVASFVWPSIVGGRRAWNDEMAQSYAIAAANYHDALHARAHGGQAPDGAKPALTQAREDFEEQQSALHSAQTRGQLSATVCRWLGILGAASGFVILLLVRRGAS
jgi:hypothetical protein